MVSQSPILSPLESSAPSKEVLASSGVFNKELYNYTLYAPNIQNGNNLNVAITTTVAPPNPEIPIEYQPNLTHSFAMTGVGLEYQNALLRRSSDVPISDMSVFNNYYHYDGGISFNPQSFLEQSIVVFNVYSLEYR